MSEVPSIESVLRSHIAANRSNAEFALKCADILESGSLPPAEVAQTLREFAGVMHDSSAVLSEHALPEPPRADSGVHVLTTEGEYKQDMSGWRSHCSCGWRGNWRLTSISAAEEAEGHSLDVGA